MERDAFLRDPGLHHSVALRTSQARFPKVNTVCDSLLARIYKLGTRMTCQKCWRDHSNAKDAILSNTDIKQARSYVVNWGFKTGPAQMHRSLAVDDRLGGCAPHARRSVGTATANGLRSPTHATANRRAASEFEFGIRIVKSQRAPQQAPVSNPGTRG